jgi:hypothetical protein
MQLFCHADMDVPSSYADNGAVADDLNGIRTSRVVSAGLLY